VNVRLAVSLLFGRTREENASHRRYGSILRGGVTAALAKLVSLAVSLAAVPLTIRHLGVERYGLWASLFSILAWLTLADLGLTNGLLTALSEALAKQRRDLAREYVATAFWGLCAIALLVGAVAVACLWRIDWAALMHVSSPDVAAEFRAAVLAAAAVFVLNLPFTLIARVYIAAQRTEIANYWAIGSSIAGLAGLAMAIRVKGGLAVLVLGFYGLQTLVAVASGLWLFTRSFPDLRPHLRVERAAARKVFGISFAFFVSQLANLMIFQSGNLIVAHNLGPRQVAPYQTVWMLALYIAVPLQLLSATLWATIGEAYAHDDLAWIRRLVRRYTTVGLIICAPLILVLLLAGDTVVEVWAGAAARPSRELLLWMSAWACELVLLQPLIAVLGGIGRLREYSLCSIAAAVAALIGGSLAVQSFGSVGVIGATVISFLCLQLIPAAYLTMRALGHRACASAPAAETLR
jgi:O-antigen/teichoic acid export membrane protein